jgi:hypothetical protein
VVLSHAPECREVGTRKVKGGTAIQRNGGGQKIGGNGIYQGSDGLTRPDQGFADADGTETVPAWECVDGCPVALLDEQSGERGNGRGPRTAVRGGHTFGGEKGQNDSLPGHWYGDTVGASRFYYTAKSSRAERERGLDGLEVVSVNYTSWENEAREARLLVATDQFPPRVIAVSGTPSSNAHEWSTLLFGSGTTAPSLTATKSITATATSSITESKTLSWLARSLTSACTVAVSGAATNGGSPAGSAAHGTPSLTITRELTVSPPAAEPALSPARLTIKGNAASPASHPTVKPLALMRWLCRLVTPPGGTILDPFTGSGSTGAAAVLEGFRFLGIEQEAEYVAIAERRIAHWAKQATDTQPELEVA